MIHPIKTPSPCSKCIYIMGPGSAERNISCFWCYRSKSIFLVSFRVVSKLNIQSIMREIEFTHRPSAR